MSSATRELLADRYHLTERIATGGMGVVWRARDERLGRDVAIKLIRPEYADDPTFRQRLRLEARATAAIRDPHVVRLHDVCEEPDPDGGCQSFIVMELVDGQPLSTVLDDGRLPVSLVMGIVGQTASALAAAHQRQIIHRDIKPGNLMVDEDGRVTVLDFGIARAADAVALTATGHILGTARYIAPEQAAGRAATAASDVYALGVVAFECLAGAVPFDADSDVAIALAHLREPVPPLPAEVPSALAGLVERMLAKDPKDRPTASQVATAVATTPTTPTTTTTTTTDATEPIAVPVARGRTATKVLPTLPGLLDYRDTRSAPLRLATALPAVGLAVVLLVAAGVAGGASGAPRSAASGHRHVSARTGVGQAATHKGPVDPFGFIGGNWAAIKAQIAAMGLAASQHAAPHHPAPQHAAAPPHPEPHPKPPKPHDGPDHVPPGPADKHDH